MKNSVQHFHVSPGLWTVSDNTALVDMLFLVPHYTDTKQAFSSLAALRFVLDQHW